MKKYILTLLAALAGTAHMVAQQQNVPMTFVGHSQVTVSTMTVDTAEDVVLFTMNDMTTGTITLPEMKGMATIPSITIENASFAMGAGNVVTFPEQTFSTSVVVNGVEKAVTGESLTGSYTMADKSLELHILFRYGSIPFPVTYNFKGVYVKDPQGIGAISAGQGAEAVYHLNGQKAGDAARGLVVAGGRKVLR